MLRRRHRTAAHTGASAAIFAALGDETRLRLIARLSDAGPMSIASLADGFDISRQAISKHLRVMNDAGLAKCGRRGRETVWELEAGGLADASRYLQLISKDWDDKLRRLKNLVESRATV
ncbi:MAG: metalloregulator ArsR/SmtB family transcription factor [Cyanobacteria bacterium]|nr:metalloregulator ArsR/SmtB family transcription factor [Cyanobacteriota bacterium]